jgi:hypothetical protein
MDRCRELTPSMMMPEITGKVEYGRIDDLQWDMIFRPVQSALRPGQDTRKLTWKDQGPFQWGNLYSIKQSLSTSIISHAPAVGLHVSISSHRTGLSDQYPLHDDVHEPRLCGQLDSPRCVRSGQDAQHKGSLNRLRMDIPDTASSSSRPVAVFVDSVISTTGYLDRV